MPSVLDILRPQVVTKIMNEVRTPFDRFQDFFGMGPGGPNTVKSETRSVSVDIANDDRTVGRFTAPGREAAVIAPMVIGNRQVTAPRTFERMDLSYETLNNIREIGSAADPGSQAGLSYVRQMGGHMLRRTRRFREFLIWGMLRGTCQFLISGNDWEPVISGGTITLDWQVPATHKNQLDGIIDISWDTAATALIITDLGQINAKAEQDSGIPITHAWCNTSRWTKILDNTQVRNMGGSAQEPFVIFRPDYRTMENYGGEGTSVMGNLTEHTGILRAFPSITWHITDRGLKLNGTFTKYLGDDEVIFHGDPDGSWTWMYEVKESANQIAGAQPVDVYGYGSWIKYPHDTDVPKYVLYSMDNVFPVLNPNAVFFADVTP